MTYDVSIGMLISTNSTHQLLFCYQNICAKICSFVGFECF